MGGGHVVACVLGALVMVVAAATAAKAGKGDAAGQGPGRGQPAAQPYVIPLRNVLHNNIRLASRYDHP